MSPCRKNERQPEAEFHRLHPGDLQMSSRLSRLPCGADQLPGRSPPGLTRNNSLPPIGSRLGRQQHVRRGGFSTIEWRQRQSDRSLTGPAVHRRGARHDRLPSWSILSCKPFGLRNRASRSTLEAAARLFCFTGKSRLAKTPRWEFGQRIDDEATNLRRSISCSSRVEAPLSVPTAGAEVARRSVTR
jgi:hypothetical protein